jgi:hypothetical protein
LWTRSPKPKTPQKLVNQQANASPPPKILSPLKQHQAIAALNKGLGKYQLSGASRARKHGDFFFSQELNPFATYFPSAMGQINYVSILMTE